LVLNRPLGEEAILNLFSGFDLESEEVLGSFRWHTNRLRLGSNVAKQLLFADGTFNLRSTVPFGFCDIGHQAQSFRDKVAQYASAREMPRSRAQIATWLLS
jgi:hypothetical protein